MQRSHITASENTPKNHPALPHSRCPCRSVQSVVLGDTNVDRLLVLNHRTPPKSQKTKGLQTKRSSFFSAAQVSPLINPEDILFVPSRFRAILSPRYRICRRWREWMWQMKLLAGKNEPWSSVCSHSFCTGQRRRRNRWCSFSTSKDLILFRVLAPCIYLFLFFTFNIQIKDKNRSQMTGENLCSVSSFWSHNLDEKGGKRNLILLFLHCICTYAPICTIQGLLCLVRVVFWSLLLSLPFVQLFEDQFSSLVFNTLNQINQFQLLSTNGYAMNLGVARGSGALRQQLGLSSKKD